MSSAKWLNCRLSDIQEELGVHRVSKPVISRLLKAKDYRLRVNSKQLDAKSQHPERNRQFEYMTPLQEEAAKKLKLDENPKWG